MTLTRRNLLICSASALGLAACGDAPPEGPGTITASASMEAGANPGPDGSDRPLTVTLVELRGTGSFEGADIVALQDPATALAADLVRMDQIVLAPGGSGALAIPVMPGATALGIVAGFRDAAGKTFRTTIPLPPTGDVPVNITVSAAGLSVT